MKRNPFFHKMRNWHFMNEIVGKSMKSCQDELEINRLLVIFYSCYQKGYLLCFNFKKIV